MALVSLETASSTENLRSFKNQRIMSSSSLPFLPVGRPGCSLASRSFTSTTSFARDTVQPTPDKQGQPIVSATHPIPLLMTPISAAAGGEGSGNLGSVKRRVGSLRTDASGRVRLPWRWRRCGSAPRSWRGSGRAEAPGRRS